MRIKVTKMDKLFSRLVRSLAGWCCERCHTKYPEGARGLHCSHYFGRRSMSCRLTKKPILSRTAKDTSYTMPINPKLLRMMLSKSGCLAVTLSLLPCADTSFIATTVDESCPRIPCEDIYRFDVQATLPALISPNSGQAQS